MQTFNDLAMTLIDQGLYESSQLTLTQKQQLLLAYLGEQSQDALWDLIFEACPQLPKRLLLALDESVLAAMSGRTSQAPHSSLVSHLIDALTEYCEPMIAEQLTDVLYETPDNWSMAS